ncbi:MAG: riboflavin kinase, partial [Eubacterium sp.]|nr:riboflavin kinase [Eubacterium sp.]
NFTFDNTVIDGDKRCGKIIGFPTINQHLPKGLVVPKFGVYETRTFVDDKEYKSFTNIGMRPTWQVDMPLCETHIFNFDGNLYGKVIRVELVRYLREEKKFSSIDEIRAQLEYDKSSII